MTFWGGLLLSACLTLGQTGPRPAKVVADQTEVLVEPDEAAYSTGRLGRGRKVTIRRDGPDGWTTIDPPPGSFSYVEESELEDLGDGTARILTPFASVRPGCENARQPGPARVTLKMGTVVTLLDRRPLVVRKGAEIRTWVAIAPPSTEVRFVRVESLAEVEDEKPPTRRRREKMASQASDLRASADSSARDQATLPTIDEEFLLIREIDRSRGVSDETVAALGKIAESQRAELKKPISKWKLKPVEDAYAALLKSGVESADKSAIQERLGQARRQREAGDAAAKIEGLLFQSRTRDAQAKATSEGKAKPEGQEKVVYDSTGLLQTTSKLVDGRKVYALLNDEGAVVCYLSAPPGLEIEPLLSKRVGVRGAGKYDENLRAKLINVRDIEKL